MTRLLIKNHWQSLVFFALLIIAIQTAGAYVTFPSVATWYKTLTLPAWTPPNWVFGPVWTILYIMLALCGWLLWNNTNGTTVMTKMKSPALRSYFIQLFFNALWSPIFFGMKNPVLGLICIIALAISAFMTLYHSNKQGHKIVAYMLIPYCLWIAFASQLNAAIVMMN